MKSDIEIARSIELTKIKQIAREYGIPVEEISNYGRYIAKVPETLIDEEKVKKSNLILVTVITPTKAGIGKTTVSIGLAHGGTANRTAESPPSGDRIERSLSKEECPKTIENTGSSLCLVV